MIIDKLHENDIHSTKRLQWLDISLSNALSLQAVDQAHSNQANLPQNKSNFIANVDSGIDDELLREIK